VNVFALGVVRHQDVFYGKATGIGNPVIYVGAKTGRDGIHGASMASAEFTEESQQKRPNVQVGDPFMEKLLLEACLEVMQTGAVVGIQDMGAAGLTCSTCEMGDRAGTGIEIELTRVPQRDRGMNPYEIMLSESQERMLLVAEKGREQEVFDVFRKWGLDAVQIGSVTATGNLVVKNRGEVVADIPNHALAQEAPLYNRPYTKPLRAVSLDAPPFASKDLRSDLEQLLASADLCNKRWIWRQYDYMVRTNTLAGPNAADAAIVRVKETGTSVAMSLDGNSRWCYIDPREGTKLIVAECCRNLSTVGALPVATTNNLNFGNPERPEIMAQLVESIEGLAEACAFFDVPVTGGNVSLYNETLGDAIYPSPVIGIVGVLPTAPPVTIDFKNAGRSIVLIGGIGAADEQRFGGTEYAKVILAAIWGLPPALDMEYEKRVQACIRHVVADGLAESAHDVSSGGLAVALAECSFANGIGARVDLDSDLRNELLLFHEGPSRIVVSTSDSSRIQQLAAEYGVESVVIGVTIIERLQLNRRGSLLFDTPVSDLKRRWETAFSSLLTGEPDAA
jgi:phosphoribosylformylglycinamidine synthase subunit PurL